jgi:hypothetical protein
MKQLRFHLKDIHGIEVGSKAVGKRKRENSDEKTGVVNEKKPRVNTTHHKELNFICLTTETIKKATREQRSLLVKSISEEHQDAISEVSAHSTEVGICFTPMDSPNTTQTSYLSSPTEIVSSLNTGIHHPEFMYPQIRDGSVHTPIELCEETREPLETFFQLDIPVELAGNTENQTDNRSSQRPKISDIKENVIMSDDILDPRLRLITSGALPEISSSLGELPISTTHQNPSLPTSPINDKATPSINEENNIHTMELILAKWSERKKKRLHVWYLLKWEGYPNNKNLWARKANIDPIMVDHYNSSYKRNHLGVKLVNDRIQRGKKEYEIKWLRRPASENSWLKKDDISTEKIKEYEKNTNRQKNSNNNRGINEEK